MEKLSRVIWQEIREIKKFVDLADFRQTNLVCRLYAECYPDHKLALHFKLSEFETHESRAGDSDYEPKGNRSSVTNGDRKRMVLVQDSHGSLPLVGARSTAEELA